MIVNDRNNNSTKHNNTVIWSSGDLQTLKKNLLISYLLFILLNL